MRLAVHLLVFILFQCNPALTERTVILKDTVVLAGDSTILNCSKLAGDSTILNCSELAGDSTILNCSELAGDSTILNCSKFAGDSTILNCSKFAGDSTILNCSELAGDSTILNCSESTINWYRYHLGEETDYDDVFMDRTITEEYEALGFRIEEDQTFCKWNLIIENVTTDLAGKYECNYNRNERNLTELIVLEKLPECNINMDEFIGPNDCNIPLDDILLSCSVGFCGNKAPELEWRKHGETIEVLESNCMTERNNLTRCNITMKPDVALNGSYFGCQTTGRAANEQYKCTANVTVLYAFSGEESNGTATYIGDTVGCVANSSQSCTYKWVWYEKVGNDISRTIESSDHVLIARKIGLHRCEAQCDLRKQSCLVFPKFIDVILRPTQSPITQCPQENTQWTPLAIGLFILGVLSYFAFGCYLFTKKRRKKPPDGNQNTTS